MKGHAEIIDLLNELLTNELTAINQYFVHAKMLENWGFLRLAKKVRAESIDEMKHADQVIDRILFLEGVPNLQRLNKLRVGETVKEQFESDVQLEYAAIKSLNEWIGKCRTLGDNATEDMLKKILVGEEEHTDWLETQLGLIGQLGETAYLAEQLSE
ncbi:MAG: bacterioferritin [Kofleriaceae bacterium]|nr:MAG: bacterioferritin [Kofleriaceae bacterium]MBZ0236996.1 bacterioferritin [Kofleriaceae bacterium]